jgi:hypothetical protein
VNQTPFFPVVLVVVFSSLSVIVIRSVSSHRRRSSATWEELLAQLTQVGRVGIKEVASDFLVPDSRHVDPRSDLALQPEDIWDLTGGLGGIEAMERNAQVLIDLAYYVQRWNTEAVTVAEQLRLDARVISQQLRLLRKSLKKGRSEPLVPVHMQRATASYYLMTRRLLALCEVSHSGLLPSLQQAL